MHYEVVWYSSLLRRSFCRLFAFHSSKVIYSQFLCFLWVSRGWSKFARCAVVNEDRQNSGGILMINLYFVTVYCITRVIFHRWYHNSSLNFQLEFLSVALTSGNGLSPRFKPESTLLSDCDSYTCSKNYYNLKERYMQHQ